MEDDDEFEDFEAAVEPDVRPATRGGAATPPPPPQPPPQALPQAPPPPPSDAPPPGGATPGILSSLRPPQRQRAGVRRVGFPPNAEQLAEQLAVAEDEEEGGALELGDGDGDDVQATCHSSASGGAGSGGGVDPSQASIGACSTASFMTAGDDASSELSGPVAPAEPELRLEAVAFASPPTPPGGQAGVGGGDGGELPAPSPLEVAVAPPGVSCDSGTPVTTTSGGGELPPREEDAGEGAEAAVAGPLGGGLADDARAAAAALVVAADVASPDAPRPDHDDGGSSSRGDVFLAAFPALAVAPRVVVDAADGGDELGGEAARGGASPRDDPFSAFAASGPGVTLSGVDGGGGSAGPLAGSGRKEEEEAEVADGASTVSLEEEEEQDGGGLRGVGEEEEEDGGVGWGGGGGVGDGEGAVTAPPLSPLAGNHGGDAWCRNHGGDAWCRPAPLASGSAASSARPAAHRLAAPPPWPAERGSGGDAADTALYSWSGEARVAAVCARLFGTHTLPPTAEGGRGDPPPAAAAGAAASVVAALRAASGPDGIAVWTRAQGAPRYDARALVAAAVSASYPRAAAPLPQPPQRAAAAGSAGDWAGFDDDCPPASGAAGDAAAAGAAPVQPVCLPARLVALESLVDASLMGASAAAAVDGGGSHAARRAAILSHTAALLSPAPTPLMAAGDGPSHHHQRAFPWQPADPSAVQATCLPRPVPMAVHAAVRQRHSEVQLPRLLHVPRRAPVVGSSVAPAGAEAPGASGLSGRATATATRPSAAAAPTDPFAAPPPTTRSDPFALHDAASLATLPPFVDTAAPPSVVAAAAAAAGFESLDDIFGLTTAPSLGGGPSSPAAAAPVAASASHAEELLFDSVLAAPAASGTHGALPLGPPLSSGAAGGGSQPLSEAGAGPLALDTPSSGDDEFGEPVAAALPPDVEFDDFAASVDGVVDASVVSESLPAPVVSVTAASGAVWSPASLRVESASSSGLGDAVGSGVASQPLPPPPQPPRASAAVGLNEDDEFDDFASTSSPVAVAPVPTHAAAQQLPSPVVVAAGADGGSDDDFDDFAVSPASPATALEAPPSSAPAGAATALASNATTLVDEEFTDFDDGAAASPAAPPLTAAPHDATVDVDDDSDFGGFGEAQPPLAQPQPPSSPRAVLALPVLAAPAPPLGPEELDPEEAFAGLRRQLPMGSAMAVEGATAVTAAGADPPLSVRAVPPTAPVMAAGGGEDEDDDGFAEFSAPDGVAAVGSLPPLSVPAAVAVVGDADFGDFLAGESVPTPASSGGDDEFGEPVAAALPPDDDFGEFDVPVAAPAPTVPAPPPVAVPPHPTAGASKLGGLAVFDDLVAGDFMGGAPSASPPAHAALDALADALVAAFERKLQAAMAARPQD